MRRRMQTLVFIMLAGLAAGTGHAQDSSPGQDSLASLKGEFQSLSRIFETMNAGDTVYSPFFPTWSVEDRGLKLRIFAAFRNREITFSGDEPIVILATPDEQEIADIRIGGARFGRMYSKLALSQDLHQAILGRQYEYRMEIPAGYRTE